MSVLRAELPIEAVCGIQDSREHHGYDLAPLEMRVATLMSGDYSVAGLEDHVAIERKSLEDLVACCGTERPRFERELKRLRGYSVKAVVVEASWSDLERGDWRSRIPAQSVTGSVLSWMSWGIPFLLCGNREAAQAATVRLLYGAARREYRKLRELSRAMS